MPDQEGKTYFGKHARFKGIGWNAPQDTLFTTLKNFMANSLVVNVEVYQTSDGKTHQKDLITQSMDYADMEPSKRGNATIISQMASVNLLEIGRQLALTAKNLQKKVEDNQRPLSIRASTLTTKIPDLKVLGDVTIFQMRKVDSEFKVSTLTLYKNEGGEAGIYTPDLEIVTGLEVVSFKSGLYGWSVLKHKSGLLLETSISYSDDHLIELEEKDIGGLEGVGMPPISYLRYLPRPEIPLWNPLIPKNVELKVLSNGKYSREHNTPLVNIKLPNGDIQKDVLCNKALERLYVKYGDGMQFKIANKKQVERKDNSQVKKVWVVDIIDCQLDLSDL